MSDNVMAFCNCTGGGYIIRAATGKREDFILSTNPEKEHASDDESKADKETIEPDEKLNGNRI